MECPHCGHELTPDEVKRLWASLGGSVKSEARARASVENGKKGGWPKGRPRGPRKAKEES